MIKPAIALCLLAQVCAADPRDGFLTTARFGATHVNDGDGDLDTPPNVWGFAAGLQLGYTLGHFTPSIAFDGARISGDGDDYIAGHYQFQHLLGAVSAKLAVEVVTGFEVFAGIGLGFYRESSDFMSKGDRLEVGASYRVWQSGRNGIRVEANLVHWDLTNPGEGYSHPVDQYGVGVAYEVRL